VEKDHVAVAEPTAAVEATIGMEANTPPLTLYRVTTQPSISATLSSKARPAFTEPLSQTSLPVAPTVTFTIVKGVGPASATLSQGKVVQGQELQPPL